MKSIFRLICMVQSVYRSLKHGVYVSGHDFIETYNTGTCQVLECEVCGYQSVRKLL